MRKLAFYVLVAWVARWALVEIAARLGPYVPKAPDPIRSPRQPGRIPGPFDA